MSQFKLATIILLYNTMEPRLTARKVTLIGFLSQNANLAGECFINIIRINVKICVMCSDYYYVNVQNVMYYV